MIIAGGPAVHHGENFSKKKIIKKVAKLIKKGITKKT